MKRCETMLLYVKNALSIFLCTTIALCFISLSGCADPGQTDSTSADAQNTLASADSNTQAAIAAADSDTQNTPASADSDTQNAPAASSNAQTGSNSQNANAQPTDGTSSAAVSNGGKVPSSDSAQNPSTDSGSEYAADTNRSSTVPQSTSGLCSLILESGTKDFFGSHPADETFFKWLAEEYGDTCIKELAQAVSAGSQTPGLWYELTGNSIHVLWLLYCRQSGIQPAQLKNVTWQKCAKTKETTLAFTGDLNFSEGYSTTSHLDSCANGIYDCFSDDLLELMNRIDILMLNNEFTYSTRGTPLPGKAFTFRADPSRAGLLKVFGTDIVNLANNHVYDYGPDALLDTIDTLNKEGIPHIGASANLKKASAPYYFVCNGRKIAFVAATQIERSTNYTKEATKDTPGVLKTLNPDKFTAVIKKAKKNSDYVIAIVHWGTEGSSYYGQDQKDLAKAFVDAGADAIVGGHTHCLQGFEIIDGVPVLYSTGNFWFSRRTQDTGLAKITISRNGKLTMSFIPCIQENLRTYLVTDVAQKQRIFTLLQQLSANNVWLTKNGTVKSSAQ